MKVPDIFYNGELVEGELAVTNLCEERFEQFRGAPDFNIYSRDEPLLPFQPIPDYAADLFLDPSETYIEPLNFYVINEDTPLPTGTFRFEAWWAYTDWAEGGKLGDDKIIIIENR